MRIPQNSIGAGAIVLWGMVASVSQAQWVDQSFDLQVGWNSIYLEVDPAPEEADTLFGGLPIDQVWSRTPFTVINGPPECVNPEDPACLPAADTGWWVWYPQSNPARVATNLRKIRGGRVYQILATAPTTLNVSGIPNQSAAKWRSGFNQKGFHVVSDINNAPTFADYLSGSSALSNASVYETASDGLPTPIVDPATTKIIPGKGYWVSSSQNVEYDGPLAIDAGSRRGIDYRVNIAEHSVDITNQLSGPAQFTITYQPSTIVPLGPLELPMNEGNVPLSWLDYGEMNPNDALTWKSLSSKTWSLDASATVGAERSIQLAVNRSGLGGALLNGEGLGSQYEGILEVTNGAGYRRWLPVASQVLPGISNTVSGGAVNPKPGLYFGTVTIDQVAWITAGARVWTNDDPNDPTLVPNPDQDTTLLRPTPAEFTFPVLIHLSQTGMYKLLKEVTYLFDPGDEQQNRPSQFVLATPACDPAVCGAFVSGSIQNGQPFARRISTAAFSFAGDLSLSGGFDSSLTGQTILAQDDPHNPFHHRYHPDHDCDQEGECYDITRNLTFTTDAGPALNETRPGWGDRFLTGTYFESINGLNKNPIQVAGRFEISRISTIATLNAQ